MQLIAATNLSYSINDKSLFHNLSFSLDKGTALHIQGSNGSGKSTLLRVLLGISSPTKGTIEYFQPNLKIAYLGHKNAIKSYLTPIQNLNLIFHSSELKVAFEWLNKLELLSVQDELTANLSFGQQKKLALIRVLAQTADLIFLDEPFVGLDNLTRELLGSFLQDRISEGSSLILTSHISPTIQCKELLLESSDNE